MPVMCGVEGVRAGAIHGFDRLLGCLMRGLRRGRGPALADHFGVDECPTGEEHISEGSASHMKNPPLACSQ